ARHPLRGDHRGGVGIVLAEEAVEHLADLVVKRELGRTLVVTNDAHVWLLSVRYAAPGRRCPSSMDASAVFKGFAAGSGASDKAFPHAPWGRHALPAVPPPHRTGRGGTDRSCM